MSTRAGISQCELIVCAIEGIAVFVARGFSWLLQEPRGQVDGLEAKALSGD